MEAESILNNNLITNKTLYVLGSIDQTRNCSICNSDVYPARLEYYQEELMLYFEFCNLFCQNCGLFEYEPEEDIKIEFSNPQHQEIYLNTEKSFT
ncbi:MAG: hypothetical protein GF317_18375 [Candidatus Lokiarchaeota archaeon]|nr:hypothetical protein [Candidatus Lokiarchaeota archaeon]MBD3201483.1 hypothetical protein [Candidatus Lokiarchaeota archaeon]